VGAGSGVWSLAMAVRHAEARVTAVDFPAVLHPVLACGPGRGVPRRGRPLWGQYHAGGPAPGSGGRVGPARRIQRARQARARALVARAARALRRGGEVVVVDSFAGGSPGAHQANAVYALLLALRTARGTAHKQSAVERWLRDAGLADARRLELSAPLESL